MFRKFCIIEYFLWLNDLIWFRYRSLNVLAVMPIQCFVLFALYVVTVAVYTACMFLVVYFSWNGHASLVLQLQLLVSSTCGLFFLIMRALSDKWKWNLSKTTYFLIMENRGSKVIATIYLTSPWAAIWGSWSLRCCRPWNTEPSRQKIWKRKRQPV